MPVTQGSQGTFQEKQKACFIEEITEHLGTFAELNYLFLCTDSQYRVLAHHFLSNGAIF